MKFLDVIIVNYNSTPQLLQCIRSLLNTSEDISLKIHVQDNASQEGDVSVVARNFPEVLLKRNNHNLGFAKAVNRAIENGNAPYVLILNPDTLVLPDLISTTLRYMENHPAVGILGPKILDKDNTIQGSARTFPNLLTALFGRKSISLQNTSGQSHHERKYSDRSK